MTINDIEDPVLLSPTQLVSSSKLSKNLGAYLEKIKKRPVFITREQEVEAVLINIEDYDLPPGKPTLLRVG